jgi:hypothetical protein
VRAVATPSVDLLAQRLRRITGGTVSLALLGDPVRRPRMANELAAMQHLGRPISEKAMLRRPYRWSAYGGSPPSVRAEKFQVLGNRQLRSPREAPCCLVHSKSGTIADRPRQAVDTIGKLGFPNRLSLVTRARIGLLGNDRTGADP